MKIPITVIIASKNEERNIKDCILSAMNFSEIIVVDSNSEDSTAEIASSLGVNVIDFSWDGRYPKKRQWILENVKTQNEWIFFLDGDERVPSRLEDELSDLFATEFPNIYSGGLMKMEYYFAGQRIRFGYKIRTIKLMKIARASYPDVGDSNLVGMGEIEGHFQPLISGKIYKLKNYLQERDSDPISSWAIRHVNYAEWDAGIRMNRELRKSIEEKKTSRSWIFHKLPFRPLNFFLYSYVLKFGFLDGKKGFDYAFGYAWFYWLSGVVLSEMKREKK